ncbi:Uncharacterised protein [Arcanobacterium haemolyticum]|nr:Uncharacterised protein [Arcanobacterium haemolyticum]
MANPVARYRNSGPHRANSRPTPAQSRPILAIPGHSRCDLASPRHPRTQDSPLPTNSGTILATPGHSRCDLASPPHPRTQNGLDSLFPHPKSRHITHHLVPTFSTPDYFENSGKYCHYSRNNQHYRTVSSYIHGILRRCTRFLSKFEIYSWVFSH